MKIGIVDADLISRQKHRFPNLACMKISAFYKAQGNNVELCCDYNNIDSFNMVYISKVFTDTLVPESVINLGNVVIGGTGFYYDKAAPLPVEIEHIMPDYHLYDEWVANRLKSGDNRKDYTYYTDYSIGF